MAEGDREHFRAVLRFDMIDHANGGHLQVRGGFRDCCPLLLNLHISCEAVAPSSTVSSISSRTRTRNAATLQNLWIIQCLRGLLHFRSQMCCLAIRRPLLAHGC